MIDLADIADIVSPHAPLQSLIALAELGLVDELELIGERAKVTFDATKLAAIVDDAARHVTSFDAAQ